MISERNFTVFRLHASRTRRCRFNIGTNDIIRSCRSVPLLGGHFASKKAFYFYFYFCLFGVFQILYLGSCPLSIDRKWSLTSLARYEISGQTDTETDSKPDMSLLGFGTNHVCIFYSRIDRALLAIRRMDKILRVENRITDRKLLQFFALISSPDSAPHWLGLKQAGEEECVATAVWCLLVELVFSDAAAITCSVILRTVTLQHPKNAIFT